MEIKNPKFQFTEEQTLKILTAANHINKAADCLTEINGMLTGVLNAFALEMLDQIGLSEELYEKMQPQLKISQAEVEEVESIINELGDL